MLRFPGGEGEIFDWRSDDPDSDTPNISDLRAVMDYCAEMNISLSFTFPSKEFVDAAGNINISEAVHQDIARFFVEIFDYADQVGVDFAQVKIGNEYNLSATRIGPDSYGEVAAQLTNIIGNALGERNSDVDIIIESGVSWASGGSNHPSLVQDGFQKYLNEIDQASQPIVTGYLDGIDIHSAYRSLQVDYLDFSGFSENGSGGDFLSLSERYQVIDDWWTAGNDGVAAWVPSDLEFHNLAWSFDREPSGTTSPETGGASLAAASMAILQFHTMSTFGVESAMSWQAVGWSNNSLFDPGNGSVDGDAFAKAGATLLSLMQDAVAGKVALHSADTADSDILDRTGRPDVMVRAFADSAETVVYIANLTNADHRQVSLDLPGLVPDGFSSIEAVSLTVEGDPGNDMSRPVVAKILDTGSAMVVCDGNAVVSDGIGQSTIDWSLSAHEILQITISHDSASSTMTATAGEDTQVGTKMDDTLIGQAVDDTITGNDGNDRIEGHSGNDHLNGGAGTIRFSVDLAMTQFAVVGMMTAYGVETATM